MADKALNPEKRNRVVEFISKEHKGENLILSILSIFAIELGVLLLTKYLVIPESAFLIGGEVASKVFSWILVVLGSFSLILSVASFYRPSFAEIKHITGLKRAEFIGNIIKVVIFSVVMALFFVLCEAVINQVVVWLTPLFDKWF